MREMWGGGSHRVTYMVWLCDLDFLKNKLGYATEELHLNKGETQLNAEFKLSSKKINHQ